MFFEEHCIMYHTIKQWKVVAGGLILTLALAGTSGAALVTKTLLVDLDATGLPTGALPSWTNSGSLGNFTAEGDPTVTNSYGVNAVEFDGAGDRYVGPNATAGMEDENNRSIEAWVYNPAVAAEESVVSWSHRGTLARNNSYNFGTNADFGAAGHWGAANDMGWGTTPSASAWHHLAWTYDGTDMRVYVDGGETNSKNFGNPLDSFNSFSINIGAQRNIPATAVDNNPASMSIAKVRIHDGFLTGADVLNNYNEEKAAFVGAFDHGDFEIQPATRWKTLTDVSTWGTNHNDEVDDPPEVGEFYAELGTGGYGNGGIYQSFETVAGTTYDLAFWGSGYVGHTTHTAFVAVGDGSFDGVVGPKASPNWSLIPDDLLATTQVDIDRDAADATPGPWNAFSYQFTATSDISTVTFWNDVNHAARVDNITITVIPEPGALTLLILGGVGLLAWRPRSRRRRIV